MAEALNLWRALLGVKNAGSALAKALPQKRFSKLAAKAGLRAIREGGRPLQTLALALPRSAGLQDEDSTDPRSALPVAPLAGAGRAGLRVSGARNMRRSG